MSKPTTHVLFVTDMSGSMQPLAKDVRGGFNTYVGDLRNDDKRYRLTVTLFDDQFETLCVNAKLPDVPVMDESNYAPRGMTALLDAVGKTVTGFESRVTLGEEDRVLVVVQTDGHENHSREYNRDQIAAMVKQREASGKWSFMFLGAGIDAWAQAQGMGFDRGSTISTAATSAGTHSTYSGLSAATRSYSRGASGTEASGLVADAAEE